MTTPILETPRLHLRPIVMDDHVWVQQHFPEWDVVRYMLAGNVPWPYPADGAKQFFTDKLIPKTQSGVLQAWAIVEKASHTPIGVLNLKPGISGGGNRGFWLGTAWHGKGYMSETVRVTTDYAFGALGMPRLVLNNAKPNTASAKLKIKANAALIREEEMDFVGGRMMAQWWELTPKQWATSPLKCG